MAEQFLTLMADLDEESQHLMSGWYDKLKDAGFDGVQTHGLPFHISIASYKLEREKEAVELVKKVAESFHPFYGKIVRLHLCAFWPTREILTIDLV